MIGMEERYWEIIKNILSKYPYTFYAYGSRTKETHRPTSDLDICFKDKIPFNVQAHIEEEFEESNLPFQVQLSDYNLMQEEFRHLIDKDLVVIQEKKK